MKSTKSNILYLPLLLVFLYSCEKEEQPFENEHIPGDETTTSVFIDPDYKYQVFYDFETNTEVERNLSTAWDLAFECDDDGYHIKLNSSRGMKVWASGKVNFSDVQSSSGATWKWDNPNGSIDSTGIGEWRKKNENVNESKNEIYVLDLGYDTEGNMLGIKKLKILGLENDEYQIKVADLSGENEFHSFIRKDDAYNFVFLSIINSEIVTIEPPKEDWDLAFTKYTHTFYVESTAIPYGVTGVLINSYATSAHQDVFHGFEGTDLEIAKELNYLSDQNTIGYDWKNYDHDAGVYSIDYDRNYIIKNRKGLYYKMRFIDFFNDIGEKGNMKFEFQRL
jgi:hypothetical protein